MPPYAENILGQGNSLIQKLQKEANSRDLTHECSGGESLDLLSLARAEQAGTVADYTPGPKPRPFWRQRRARRRDGGVGRGPVELGVAWKGVASRPGPSDAGQSWGLVDLRERKQSRGRHASLCPREET